MYSETFDDTAPLTALTYKWMDIIFGASRWTHVIFSTLLIITQAAIFNSTLLRNKAFDENNYLPSFFYVVAISGITDFMSLSPHLLSLTFLLLGLDQVFRRIDNVATDELFLKCGLFVGLATFFYLPSLIFFIIFLASFLFFSSAIIRRVLLFAYGFGIVFLLVWAYFFWRGASNDFLSLLFDWTKPIRSDLSWTDWLWTNVALAGVFLLCLFQVLTKRYTNFQQKMIQVMFFFIIGAIACFFLTKNRTGVSSILFVPSISFFLTHFTLSLRRRWTKAVMPNLFILAIIAWPYWVLKHNNPSLLQISDAVAKYENKRIMTLTESLSVYQNNYVATPFIDEFQSKKKLRGLDYYDKASSLFQVIVKSKPEIIIDEWGYMPLILDRYPMLKKRTSLLSKGVYEVRASN